MNLAKHLKIMWIFACATVAATLFHLHDLSASEAEKTRHSGSSLHQITPCAEFLSLVQLHSNQLVAAIRTPDSDTLKKLFEELHLLDPIEIAAMTAQIKLGALLNASIVQEAIVRAWVHLYPDKSRLVSAVKHFKDISKESERLYLVDLVLAELLCLTPTSVALTAIGDLEKIATRMRMTSSAFLELANQMHQLSQTDLGFYNIRLAIYANLYLAQPELIRGISNRSGAFQLFWIRRDKQRTPMAPKHKSVTSFEQFRRGRSTYFDTAELTNYLKYAAPAARSYFIFINLRKFTDSQLNDLKRSSYFSELSEQLQAEINQAKAADSFLDFSSELDFDTLSKESDRFISESPTDFTRKTRVISAFERYLSRFPPTTADRVRSEMIQGKSAVAIVKELISETANSQSHAATATLILTIYASNPLDAFLGTLISVVPPKCFVEVKSLVTSQSARARTAIKNLERAAFQWPHIPPTPPEHSPAPSRTLDWDTTLRVKE